MPWAREAYAVFAREVRGEWRTRVALSGTFLFAVCALTLISLSLKVDGNEAPRAGVLSALLWLLLLFTAATGLGRAYVQEEERGTALALRLMARGTTVWAGKWAANLLLLLTLTLLATPILLSLWTRETSDAPPNLGLLLCVLLVGGVGIAAVFTTTSALVAQASARGGGLLAALSFPVLVPALMAGVHGTLAALGVGTKAGASHVPFAMGAGDIKVLASYAVIAITASLLLIDFVWGD